MTRLYIDLDGVMADFDLYFMNTFGVASGSLDDPPCGNGLTDMGISLQISRYVKGLWIFTIRLSTSIQPF